MFLSHGALVTKTPVSIAGGTSYFPYMPPMATHGWPSAYSGIYSRQLWVYVVVSKLAKGTARLPLPVYRREGADGGDRKRDDEHPMARLLRKPNPAMSGYDLWLWTSATRDIYGDTAWYKRRQRGQVVGLYPLHPASMHHEDGAWHFDNGTLRLDDIADRDLVWFRHFHPDSLTRGLSPLEPLRSTLENEWSARAATSSFWQRGARPGTALTHPGTISEPAADRLKKQYDGITAGAGNTGATVVLEEGMKPERMDLTAEEAQYIETRKLNREEVCAAYDVPPPVVHILDRATFSNITEQMRSMYRDTMGAILPGFEATLETDLRQVEWPDDEVYAEFLLDGVLRGDFEARQDALAKATHMTIAEKRKVENLPFIEGTDRIFLNTATLPLDAIDAQTAAVADTAPAAPVEDDDLPENVIPLTVARAVLGRLSWQRSLEQVEDDVLVRDVPPSAAQAVKDALRAERRASGSVKGLKARLKAISAKAPADVPHADKVRQVLADYFRRQPDLDPDQWDTELAADLHAVAVHVSRLVGRESLSGAGFDPDLYDVERTIDWLQSVSERLAGNINATTRQQLEDADDPAPVYEQAAGSRAEGIAVGVATLVAGFAAVEAGRRVAEAEGGEPTKTWVTGPNPRPEHAALDGQTVGIDEAFSNGAGWPGEDGEPGCNCTVEVGYP